MLKGKALVLLCGILILAQTPGAAQAAQAPSPGPMALQVRSEFLYAWTAGWASTRLPFGG